MLIHNNTLPIILNKTNLSTKGKVSQNQNQDTITIGPYDSASVSLHILHINDFHGVVEPVMAPEISKESPAGGIAHIKTLIDQERERDFAGTILLNAGDLAEGTMVAYISKGRVVTEAFKEIGFDAITLGNHDFAWGQEGLKYMLEGLDTPVLGANIRKSDDGTVMDGLEPYIIKEMKGIKVAVIGLDTPDIAHFIEESKRKGLDFKGAAETVEKYIPEVKEKGADLVIVLSHLGEKEDEKLAAEVKGIDVIVGGHSHTKIDEARKVGDTLIVQAGAQGKFLGKLDIDVDLQSKKIVSYTSRLIPVIADEITPDPEIEKIIAPYLAEAEKFGSAVMGEASEDLIHGHRFMGKLNQIHADSIWAKSGAPFGICNSRTLRGNIKAGTVTKKDLYTALPFTEEGFVTLTIEGKYIRQHIENCLSDGATELAIPAGSLKYSYAPSKAEGHRLTSLTLDGKELDDNAEYFIFVNETMGRHKDFETAKDKKKIGSSQEEFFEYFKAHKGPWNNKTDDRITVVK
ncbi:MAG TPA: bifunctional UDP-sugar hydrolase/5'-nucleotidase [Candidatus Eremiobacteraeota bacterium]|nr:bifunctional UDP-sugar hydrolase/5'-nucleotidase [Candidatus Eremiobacteraeota bacterium]